MVSYFPFAPGGAHSLNGAKGEGVRRDLACVVGWEMWSHGKDVVNWCRGCCLFVWAGRVVRRDVITWCI